MARRKIKDETVEVENKKKRKKKTKSKDTTKRKSKSKSKELAVSDKSKKKASKKLEARLEKNRQKLATMSVDAEIIPANSESAFLNEYSHIFESLSELTRIAEDKYRDTGSSRDVYPLMAMYSQMRECIADMRSIQDLNEMSERLISSILDPLHKAIGQILIEQFFKLEKAIKSNTDPKEAELIIADLKAITSESAHKVQEQYSSSKTMVYRYFSENA